MRSFSLLLFTSILLFGCIAQGNSNSSATAAASSDSTFNKAVSTEVFRLESVSLNRNLTLEDTKKLGQLINGSDEFLGEFRELQWMITHGYAKHSIHSLGSLERIAENQTYPCPADPLDHVGIFLQFNETGMAADAAADANSTLQPWVDKVRQIKAADKEVYPDSDALLAAMRTELAAYYSGNLLVVQEQWKYIDAHAFC